MNEPGDILLLACYELGHQPLSLAWPLAFLQRAGYRPTALDLAVTAFDADAARRARVVAIAVPMHTALRLGEAVACRVRVLNPRAHITFYGLYAGLNAQHLLAGAADSVIAGEYERPLCDLVAALAQGDDLASVPGLGLAGSTVTANRERLDFPTPNRTPLPGPEAYARLMENGHTRLAGYTEASRGCRHTCAHCPVVPVYAGRFFVVPREVVLADIRQQVAAGVTHITFGDPDFLNGPGHAMRLLRALHEEHPQITFDFTTKVEHIIKHRHLFPEIRALGAVFVVSAFEAASDPILARLGKGHTTADMDTALEILAAAGLPVQPTWMPFTPWASLDDYLALLDWIRTRNLIPHVPLVQLSIRMLVPPGSALREHGDVNEWCGPLDAPNFTWQWTHPDQRMDELQCQIAMLAENAPANPYQAFAEVERLAHQMAGQPLPSPMPLSAPPQRLVAPRLTEDWYC